MKINDRYAMYIVAAGAFTSATYSTPQKLKRQVGRIAYGVEGIRKNMNFEVFDIDIAAGGAPRADGLRVRRSHERALRCGHAPEPGAGAWQTGKSKPP